MTDMYIKRLNELVRDFQDILWILRRDPNADSVLVNKVSVQIGYLKHTVNDLLGK